MGAEVIEPDLVPTKDGVLVCRHEPEISGTTDVAHHPEFADRRTTKTIDGFEYTGWFTEDFAFAELRTLRAVERLPELRQRNTIFDGYYLVPTFREALLVRQRMSDELGRTIGIIPEIKHSTYFRSLGFDVEARVVATLDAVGLNSAESPVVVQSFELTNLQQLRHVHGLRTRTVFLTSAEGAPADLVAAGDPRQCSRPASTGCSPTPPTSVCSHATTSSGGRSHTLREESSPGSTHRIHPRSDAPAQPRR
jgi:glycerophosphoryl diester phosphodiesterase